VSEADTDAGGRGDNRQGPLGWLTACVFGVVIVVVLLQVFCRYVLGSALGWAEELSVYLLVWMVFLGAAAAAQDRSHIRVDVFVDLLPLRFRMIFRVMADLLQAVFMVVMVWLGFRMVGVMSGTQSPALHLPVGYVTYAALPLTFLAGIFYTVRDVHRAWRDWRTGEGA
jgi:TRAP-type C4-dicarboxylate transport system permease small subunit